MDGMPLPMAFFPPFPWPRLHTKLSPLPQSSYNTPLPRFAPTTLRTYHASHLTPLGVLPCLSPKTVL